MTPSPSSDQTDPDQQPATMAYGHGRMPLFMKLLWIVFLCFVTWYTVTYLLTAVGQETGH